MRSRSKLASPRSFAPVFDGGAKLFLTHRDNASPPSARGLAIRLKRLGDRRNKAKRSFQTSDGFLVEGTFVELGLLFQRPMQAPERF